jgi:hypothetical protein
VKQDKSERRHKARSKAEMSELGISALRLQKRPPPEIVAGLLKWAKR